MNVVAIIHTYSQDKELGSYMTELVRGFEKVGCNLHLIITNELVSNLQASNLKPTISEDKIIEFIKQVAPSFVFTTNRGGITKKMMAEISCPIVTWMVDRIPFLHHGAGHDELFGESDYVVTSSYGNIKRLEAIYPKIRGRVFFLPFCTNTEDFKIYDIKQESINISFVGTFFYCGQLTEILNSYFHDEGIIRKILLLVSKVEKNYDLDFEQEVAQSGLNFLLKEYNLDIYKFKGLLANAVSLNSRVKNLDAVADLGLKLYGTKNWLNVNQYSLALLNCFQFDHFIKTREQLVGLYQNSKIAVNVSHHQAVNGLPYRIYDIMASKALLITEYNEDSDLFRLFGPEVPVPMYKSPQELRRLCQYYLEHEAERQEIVARCNKLISEKFSFEQRVRDFFSIIEVNIDSAPPLKGKIIKVDVAKEFYNESVIFNISQNRFMSCAGENTALKFQRLSRDIPGEYKLLLKRFLKLILPLRVRVYLRSFMK